MSAPLLNVENEVYGKLTAIKLVEIRKKVGSIWSFKCECGNIKNIPLSNVRSKSIQSCGCIKKGPKYRAPIFTREIRTSFKCMHQRCTNIKNENYKYYGAKGILICERWNDFQNFYNDLVDTYKKGLTLDRIDSKGNYEPSNCKWSNGIEQARNKSNNVYYYYNGENKCVAELASIHGIGVTTLRQRLLRGWTIEQSLVLPVTHRKSHVILRKDVLAKRARELNIPVIPKTEGTVKW